MYKITKYTYNKAKKIGVKVCASKNKTKKIDVYRKGKKIASIGSFGMNDYPSYLHLCKGNKKYANTRRRLYKIRHNKDRHKKWSKGWLADQLLW